MFLNTFPFLSSLQQMRCKENVAKEEDFEETEESEEANE